MPNLTYSWNSGLAWQIVVNFFNICIVIIIQQCNKQSQSYRPVYFFLGRKPARIHIVQCQSLCGSEVTRTIKQLEVEGGICPSAPQLATPMVTVCQAVHQSSTVKSLEAYIPRHWHHLVNETNNFLSNAIRYTNVFCYAAVA